MSVLSDVSDCAEHGWASAWSDARSAAGGSSPGARGLGRSCSSLRTIIGCVVDRLDTLLYVVWLSSAYTDIYQAQSAVIVYVSDKKIAILS